MKKFFVLIIFLLSSVLIFAEGTKEEYLSGKIIELVSEEKSDEEGVAKLQKFNVKLLEGDNKGEVVEIDFPIYTAKEYNIDVKVGDRVVVFKTFDDYGNDEMQMQYYISDVDKRMEIYIMGIIFVALVLVIARKNGLKALFALIVTVAFIVKVFIPAVFNGYSPILFAVITAKLLASASILKNINLKEVIPAGVIIGSLGAVMDVAVSIASSINELHITNPNMSQKVMFKSVINIGTDIIGTMINTLILAYIASSVFTLLLVYAQAGEYPIIRLLNFQDIAVEIMRSVCGSIGILISVPLTAYIGTLIYKQK